MVVSTLCLCWCFELQDQHDEGWGSGLGFRNPDSSLTNSGPTIANKALLPSHHGPAVFAGAGAAGALGFKKSSLAGRGGRESSDVLLRNKTSE